jgi:hypothetical protein
MKSGFMSSRFRRQGRALFCAAAIGMTSAAIMAVAATAPTATRSPDEDAEITRSLAAMLSAGRLVVSQNQDRINNPNLRDKGLDGKTVLAEAIKIYKESGIDPLSIDANSPHGKLIRMQMDSIAEVMDSHQQTLNRQGVGFKGFIPAVFGRLVNEAFGRQALGIAEVKVTAPPELIRNPKAKPDQWENEVIRDKLLSPSWVKDKSYAAVTQNMGRAAYRTAVPEYYGASCLTCHGSPKGDIDITGYAKEGGEEADLGGVISITLYR